jgi:hypothetical protein
MVDSDLIPLIFSFSPIGLDLLFLSFFCNLPGQVFLHHSAFSLFLIE